MVRKCAPALLAAVLAAFTFAAPVGAASVPDLPPCDQYGALELTTSVRLRHDTTCWIIASGPRGTTLTIDLAGHTLRGAIDQDGQGTLVIRHGTVTGGLYSVLDGSLRVRGVRFGGSISAARGAENHLDMRDSQVRGAVVMTCSPVVIDHSVIGGGIAIDDTYCGMSLTITNNLISGSPGHGISVSASWLRPDVGGTISDNVLVHSAGSGIHMGDPSLLAIMTVSGNLLLGNGGDGITIAGPRPNPDFIGGPVTLTGNVAVGNGGLGIFVPWIEGAPTGAVDGGHNRAWLNGADPQCVGVTCRAGSSTVSP